MGDLTRNFSVHEFECGCGNQYRGCLQLRDNAGVYCYINVLALHLQELRNHINKWFPLDDREWVIIVNSGYRCPAYNKKVGGVKGSQHIEGKAADIEIHDPGIPDHIIPPNQVAPLAAQFEAFRQGGIGVYDTFTHLDIRVYTARWGNRWDRSILEDII